MLDKDSLNNEISVGVTFASLMAAISLFFTGAIVSQYASFGPTIKVPMLFLIVSTFSFIFAATIYSNAGSEVTLGKLKTVEKYMIYATNIVEFLGLYPLIIATPLVIGAITEDGFLRISTTIVALIGMGLYSQSKFSILEKQLPDYQKSIYASLIVGLAVLLYLTQTIHGVAQTPYYSAVAIILLCALLIPTIFFSLRSNQYRVILVRPLRETDIKALANLVDTNLKRYKHNKQAREAIEALKAEASESSIRDSASNRDRQIIVALHGTTRVGFTIVTKDTIALVLTDPEIRRKGIGRMLVDAAETIIGEQGYEEVVALAYSPNDRFFKRLGYDVVSGKSASGGQVTLQKEL